MTQASEIWLPEGAFDFAHFVQEFESDIADWSKKWFSNFDLRFKEKHGGESAKKFETSVKFEKVCTGYELAMNQDTREYIASHILGVNFDKLTIRTQEQPLVDAVVDECLQDLKQVVQKYFGSESDDGAVEVERDLSNGKYMQLETAEDKALLYIRFSMMQPFRYYLSKLPQTGEEKPAINRWMAIQGVELSSGAHIGACQITLAELNDLQSGDVIQLDSKLNDALDFTVGGAVVADKIVKIEQKNDSIQLKIVN